MIRRGSSSQGCRGLGEEEGVPVRCGGSFSLAENRESSFQTSGRESMRAVIEGDRGGTSGRRMLADVEA